jgi:hypothetical protein
MVKNYARTNAALAAAQPGQLIVDEVVLQDASLTGGYKLSVGFYSQERRAARVDRGPRSMSNHRLDVVNLREARASVGDTIIR